MVIFARETGGTPSFLHERFKEHIDDLSREFEIPYHVVKGGHERCMNGDKTTSFAEFERIYGESMYWFEHEGWAFVVLDRWYKFYRRMPMIWEDVSPEAMDVAREMLEEIPDGMPIVIFLQENPVGVCGFLSGHMLFDILGDYPIKLLLFGHTHANYISTYRGIPHACVVGEGSSFDSTPLTYNLVTCHGDGTVVCDFKPVRTGLSDTVVDDPQTASASAPAPSSDHLSFRGDSGSRSFPVSLPEEAPARMWKTQLKGRVSVGS